MNINNEKNKQINPTPMAKKTIVGGGCASAI